MKKLGITSKQFLWAGLVLILIVLLLDFNNRVSDLIRLNKLKGQSSTQVAVLQATEQYLTDKINYAGSDTAVEEWARTEGRMKKEGDIPIIPVAPAATAPQVKVTPAPTPMPVSNWQVWFELFFGQ